MNRSRSLLAPALLVTMTALGGLSAPATADQDVRSEAAAYPSQDARLVSIEIPIGELRVVGTAGDTVEARLRVTCDRDTRRCREDAARVHLRQRRTGATLEIEVIGLNSGRRSASSPTPHVEVRLPRHLALRAELGVGEVDVRGVEGDVEVEVGVGEARVHVRESAVAEVSLDVGVGDAELVPRPGGTRTSRFLFLGNEIDWREGSGSAMVAVEVGVGEANVRLQP